MKITLCGSMVDAGSIDQIARELEGIGHDVQVPEPLVRRKTDEFDWKESARRKRAGNLIRRHFNRIQGSDAILVVNVDRGTVDGYIGGNTFLEMGFAYILDKAIYMLNNVPEMIYSAELAAMEPVILNGDLHAIPIRG